MVLPQPRWNETVLGWYYYQKKSVHIACIAITFKANNEYESTSLYIVVSQLHIFSNLNMLTERLV